MSSREEVHGTHAEKYAGERYSLWHGRDTVGQYSVACDVDLHHWAVGCAGLSVVGHMNQPWAVDRGDMR